METQGFNVGYVVMLKSGGPDMTIVGISDYSMEGDKRQASCQWFVGERKEELKEGFFLIEALEKCSDE